jgi:ABC-type transport system substrate-binding protein
MFAVSDAWQRLGVAVDPVVIPRQRARELDYVYTFPAFHLRSHSGRMSSGLPNYQSNQWPLPENRWVGNNRGRYRNAELDAAAERYQVTIPIPERAAHLQTVFRILSDQLPALNLFHDPSFAAIANRVENVVPSKASGAAAKTWDSQLWDVK